LFENKYILYENYSWVSITLEIEIMLIYRYKMSHKDLLFENEMAEVVMQTTLPISFK